MMVRRCPAVAVRSRGVDTGLNRADILSIDGRSQEAKREARKLRTCLERRASLSMACDVF